ncbi:MAG: 4Fe-4S dicluster domain-containing protein [bacterium]|nr:4Fe-4S dicluster domain-containing protein [bacterium]
MTDYLVHNKSLCKNCGSCVAACFRKNFDKNAEGHVILKESAAGNCILCGHCIAACPLDNCISISGSEWTGDSDRRVSFPPDDLAAFLKQRRTRRMYREKQPSREELSRLIDTARYAPSGHNSQNYNFIVIEGREKVKAVGAVVLKFYAKIISMLKNPLGRRLLYLVSGKSNYSLLKTMKNRLENHVKIYREEGSIQMVWDAPAMIIIHGPEGQDTSVNCALAGYNIILQAEADGLATCILGLIRGGFDHVKKQLTPLGITIPRGHKTYMVISVGHPAPEEKFEKIPPRKPAKVTFIS